MAHRAVLHLIYVFGVFQKGLTALIQTQQTVMAAEGEEVTLKCQLTQSKEVLQVTWLKLLSDGEKILATNNKLFGQKVNHDFRDKVEFKDGGLQNSSIVIKKVTEQDEGCYHCLFNTYPEGALTGTTCLQLYELHEPVLHVGGSNSTEEAVVSCSATGRPAPTVTLSLLQQDLHLSNYSSVTVTNTNGTVTVTSSAVLSGFHGNGTQVGCAARVLSGPQIEVFMMIPEVKQSSADGFQEKSVSDNSDFNFTWIVVLSVVVSCVCVAVIIGFMFIQKHWNSLSHRDSEDIKTPQKPTGDTHETKTPLIKQENELRQRMSTGKNDKNSFFKASPLTGKCQRKLFLPKSTV